MKVQEHGGGLVEITDVDTDLSALRQTLDDGFATHGWVRVEARLPRHDQLAHQLLTRAGLRREGTLRGAGPDGGDVVLLARLATDPDPESREGRLAVLDTIMPAKRAIAQMLVRDLSGRILLCETTYKAEWDLPGGIVDPGEPPSAAAAREVAEELGLDLAAGHLLAVDWLPPYRGWSDALLLVFDGGVHPPALTEEIVTQPREIRAVHWATLAEARQRCAPYVVILLDHLDDVTAETGTVYLVAGEEHPPRP